MIDHEHLIAQANCAQCPLRFHPVMGQGNEQASLVILNDGPGFYEKKHNKPIASYGGELLDQSLKLAGEDPEKVWKTNVVLCRAQLPTGEDTDAPAAAIAACRPRLLAELRAINPKLIVTTGANATKAVFGSGVTLSDMQGVVEYPRDMPAPVLPTYSPKGMTGEGIKQFDSFLSSIKRSVGIAQGTLTLMDRNEHIPWKHVTTAADIKHVLCDLLEGKAGFTLGLDVETSGLSIVDTDLLQISIGNTERGVALEYSGMADDHDCMSLFRILLTDTRFTWIIHNMSFDRQRFKKFFDVVPAQDIDTMCLALGLTERGEGVGLKQLSRELLNAPYYEKDVHAYLGPDQNWASIPRGVLAQYAVLDTVYTARVFPILERLCTAEGTRDLAYNLLMPAQRMFADVETHGVLVDQTYVQTLETVWAPKVEEARAEIQSYARAQGWKRSKPGKSFSVKETVMVDRPLYVWTTPKGVMKHGKTPPRNIADYTTTVVQVPTEKSVRHREADIDEPLNVNSPTQMAAFLFDHLQLSVPPEGRKTGKEFREYHPDHQFTHLHGEYALMNRMLNTYVRGIGNEIASDGRVHPNFLLFGAVTGRLAIHHPAIQTIPRGDSFEDKDGSKRFDSIKRMFLPSEGCVWGETDYAQLELRVGWHLSNDESFGRAIMSGDFHRFKAAEMLNKPIEDVSDAERHDIKRVNFGIMYGRQAPAIAKQLGCSVGTAQWYVDSFFETAPKYRDWYREQHRLALSDGRSTTPFGRVRRWNLINRENKQNVLNQAVNFPVQSVASDLNLLAAIHMNQWFKETGWGHILFLVHDSMCYEIREGKEAIVTAKVRETMTTWPFESQAVLDVETKIGPSWGDVAKTKY